MTAKKYRKKPVVVEAMEWLGTKDCYYEVNAWMHPGKATMHPKAGLLTIPTMEGDMVASPGDYIIKGVKDEFFPCRADIFALTYEEA